MSCAFEDGGMLSEDERRVLAMFCFNYQVAACRDCQRGFKLTETHVEVGGLPAHPHVQGDQPGSG